MDSTNTISDHTANSSPEVEPTRRGRFAAFNKRLASKCYSFGGIAFLMFFLLLASEECDDEEPVTTEPVVTDPGPTDPGPTDPGPTDPGPTDPGPGCDPPEEPVTPPVVTPPVVTPPVVTGTNTGGNTGGNTGTNDDDDDPNYGWAEDNHQQLLDTGVDPDAIPEDSSSETTTTELDTLLAEMEDQEGFDPDRAQEFLTDTLTPGTEIDRVTMAQIMCAGMDSCTPTDNPDDAITVLAEEGVTTGHDGQCAQNPATCAQTDFESTPGETMTNAQMIAFLSRVLEESGDGDGNDNYGNDNYGNDNYGNDNYGGNNNDDNYGGNNNDDNGGNNNDDNYGGNNNDDNGGNNNPPPQCPSGQTVIAQYVDSANGDNGCRPTTCPQFGRAGDGHCLTTPVCQSGQSYFAQYANAQNGDDGCRPTTCPQHGRAGDGYCLTAPPPPGAPQNVLFTCSETSNVITLTARWDPPTSEAAGYQVQISDYPFAWLGDDIAFQANANTSISGTVSPAVHGRYYVYVWPYGVGTGGGEQADASVECAAAPPYDGSDDAWGL